MRQGVEWASEWMTCATNTRLTSWRHGEKNMRLNLPFHQPNRVPTLYIQMFPHLCVQHESFGQTAVICAPLQWRHSPKWATFCCARPHKYRPGISYILSVLSHIYRLNSQPLLWYLQWTLEGRTRLHTPGFQIWHHPSSLQLVSLTLQTHAVHQTRSWQRISKLWL